MAEISRALTLGHVDRAFVLLTETVCSRAVAAAFLIESGVDVVELPREAKRAIVDAIAA
jgi:hypothetical protein